MTPEALAKMGKDETVIANQEQPAPSKIESGLPTGSTKPENLARLEKSRRQLENYRKTGLFHRTTEPASTAERSSETEKDAT